jgi:hypothetical protein
MDKDIYPAGMFDLLFHFHLFLSWLIPACLRFNRDVSAIYNSPAIPLRMPE